MDRRLIDFGGNCESKGEIGQHKDFRMRDFLLTTRTIKYAYLSHFQMLLHTSIIPYHLAI